MNRIKQHLIAFMISFLSAVSLSQVAIAENAANEAEEFVHSNAAKVVAILQNSSSKEQQLEDLFLKVVDYDWMGQFVLGRYWPQLSDAERKQYLEAYKEYLSSIYVSKYEEYNKQRYKVYNADSLGGDQYQVSMIIYSSNSDQQYKISYKLKKYDNTFKIRDIVAEGISLLATQRADFSGFLSSHNMSDLITNLKNKAAQQV